jgi:hypothetical protein
VRFSIQRPIALLIRAGSLLTWIVVLALALSPATKARAAATLYLTANGVGAISGLWTVNPATGAATYVGPIKDSGAEVYLYSGGLAYDSYAHVLYASGDSFLGVSTLYTINPTTAAATTVGPAGAAMFGTSGLAFDPGSHKLYAVGRSSGSGQPPSFFDVNPSTGAATLIGAPLGVGTILNGAGLDPVSGTLYANGTNDFLSSASKLFVVNKGTGAETVVGSHGLSLGREMYYGSIAFDPLTDACYANGSVNASEAGLFALNRTTGAATLIGSFGPGAGGSDGGLTFVPDGTTGVGPFPREGTGLAAGPNPFPRGTTLSYTLGTPADVVVELFDIAGHRTATLWEGHQQLGVQHVTWSGASGGSVAPAGVYFVHLVIDRKIAGTLKLVHLGD